MGDKNSSYDRFYNLAIQNIDFEFFYSLDDKLIEKIN